MREDLTALLVPLWVPFRALLFAFGGALTAARWLESDYTPVVIILFILLPMSVGLFHLGRQLLPKRPRLGLALMECWLFAPLGLTLVASAFAVMVGVWLVAPESAAAEQKAVLSAIATAITTFLGTAVVAWSEDQNQSRASSRIRGAFQTKFKGRFPPGSPNARWVFSDHYGSVQGWGLEARWQRASAVTGAKEGDAGQAPGT